MSTIRSIAFLLTACALSGAGGVARADLHSSGKLSVPADFRLRLEQDFASQDASGVERADRLRARVRLRLGLLYEHDEHWSFEVRLRSGSDRSHQSPHVTVLDFTDDDTGDANFNLDRWYVKGQDDGFWAWAGRNSHPFWTQNEMLLDADATLAGIAGGWGTERDRGTVRIMGGYFSLPVGMQGFSGNLGALQAVYSRPGDLGLTFAAGLYDFGANANDPDSGNLLNGNGLRDYSILELSAQGVMIVDEHPLTLGVDLLHNAEDYSPTDATSFTAANNDETDGLVVSLRYGDLRAAGSWLFGYTYARIEALAVNASYAEDDWVRWGSAVESRSSNMRGHELRIGHAVAPQANVLLRVYLAEAISSVEDGNRARIDLNYRF